MSWFSVKGESGSPNVRDSALRAGFFLAWDLPIRLFPGGETTVDRVMFIVSMSQPSYASA